MSLLRALAVLCLLPGTVLGGAPPRSHDLVVYGATAGGVITAVSAAREGLTVALLEPGDHVGGMVSGGLGATDFGRKEVIGGLSLEFFLRVGRRYGQPVGWYFEPHVAEEVFREMLSEAGVPLFLRHRLRERGGVGKRGTRLTELRLENGRSFRATVFADATYEGDLMAQAGVWYTWGREGTRQYGESLAGVRERTPKHQFLVRVPGRDAKGRLLPEIQRGPRGEPGQADRKVQAYNFRLCLTDVKENQVPFPKPKRYDAKRYALLARYLEAFAAAHGRPARMGELMHSVRMPNGKTDTNNNGPFSTDYIGGNWEYPSAGYAARERIRQAHVDYVKGFFYFLAREEKVPAVLRDEMNRWGLARDEFVDTGHWPHQLYVREARRMVGEYVMTQRDVQDDLSKVDAIGMGSYNSDSHNVQRVVTRDGAAENEGDMQVPVTPYQIPYRMLLPRRAEATNLLVPVCFSASHVAYSTLRMEPQYMIVGHAAGVAARLAVRAAVAVQDVDVGALRERLRDQRAVFDWAPAEGVPSRP